VARHIDDDPALAWEHAQAAVRRAGRIATVREAAGVAAYRAGEFQRALTELRAARRMSGSVEQLPLMADCERGLGRPERALELAGSPDASTLDVEGRVEMRIVAAGARRDLGQIDAAIVTLQCPELSKGKGPWVPRLRYAYADALLAAGRTDEAVEWFERALQADPDATTEAAERLDDLAGVVFEEVEEVDQADEVTVSDQVVPSEPEADLATPDGAPTQD
jgi:tetratricopeptide (TPR) repeat protein